MESLTRLLTAVLAVGLLVAVGVLMTVSYQAAVTRHTAEQRQRHQVTVILLADAVSSSDSPYAPVYRQRMPVKARWTEPDGTARTGNVYARYPGERGDRISVWFDASGSPVPELTTLGDLQAQAWTTGLAAVSLGEFVLFVAYCSLRTALDRRRDAAWTVEWAVVEERWRHNV
ncbi:hypothetical protein ACFF2X_41465 [Cryptosporangium minutisporangium]|uniref:DUF3592 domain-containing protein n=2 Tax=Cryptosporangium minutisporangium TaxID=113569 RepID=A0ABP6TCD3_9ACTN